MLCRCLAARWGESVCRILRQGMCTASQWLFVVYHTEEAYSNCQAGVSCASCQGMLRVPNPPVPCQIVGVSCAPTLHRLILCVCMRKAMRNTSHKTRMEQSARCDPAGYQIHSLPVQCHHAPADRAFTLLHSSRAGQQVCLYSSMMQVHFSKPYQLQKFGCLDRSNERSAMRST